MEPPPEIPRERLWMDDPPGYVTRPEEGPNLFSLEVCHQGLFCGFGAKLEYLNDTISVFDNLLIDTWSNAKLDEILSYLGCLRDEKVHVYWLQPGKTMYEGILPLVTEADCMDMRMAAALDQSQVIFVDHANFIRFIRADICKRAAFSRPGDDGAVPAAAPYSGAHSGPSNVAYSSNAASSSVVVAQVNVEVEGGDSETDSGSDWELYDSDYDAESGDDDLFLDNVNRDVGDNNERLVIVDNEDEDALEDRDLNLHEGERDKLLYKFQEFNPQVDMDCPIFDVGLTFASIKEARQAVNAYAIRERVKLRKIKNYSTRLHVVCDEGCPWLLKVGFDLKRSGGFAVTAYQGNHICERVYELRTLTAAFLAKAFINEFRDNQKLDLTSFAAKVQREFKVCPHRWKLGRARQAALLEIHGNEEAQFAQLRDYGEELKRANPDSTFFLSTNSVKELGSDIPKEHLATLYWSYDACKRGFLTACRPLICVDGCHIKTRYKGVLLTAVGIDPNDCIYPIAMGMVEIECTSVWEWFLQTLKEDLNITNTSHWTIMSDRQKGLINAVQTVFPQSEHRFYVRHLIQNFQKAGHRGETLKNDLWAIARSTNAAKWHASMDKMCTDSVEAYRWVEELAPQTWIKAFFSEIPKCDMLLNNHSEVFNSYILGARENRTHR